MRPLFLTACLGLLALFSLPLVAEEIPEDIRQAAICPERVLDEEPCDWRSVLEPLFRPVVKDCATAREATLAIASRLSELTGVRYDTSRRHPCMNALEALAEKKVSCTGNSILLVCALRSVGIPARAVGVRSWNHVPGNHTWVEAWFDGDWHMIEANEKDFNTPWVLEAVGMLNPQVPEQRVLAAQPGGAERFPCVWTPKPTVEAVDVSERYQRLAREWYAHHGVPEGFQKLMVDVQPRPLLPRRVLLENEQGVTLAQAWLPRPQDDMRQFATLLLPRGLSCYLRVDGSRGRIPLKADEAPVQIIRLQGRGR